MYDTYLANNIMQIKVCGMRDPENISALQKLDIDMMGLIFHPRSLRYVEARKVCAGIIPDMPVVLTANGAKEKKPALVGVFVDEMIQTIITNVYNYHLDYIQLHGNESATYINNLKRTLIPDIQPDIKIIKALSIRESDDVKRWRDYKECADLLLFDTKCESKGGSGRKFDWSVLDAYDGDIPFLLSGGIGPEDYDAVRQFHHPMCAGIDLNSRFETEPGMKDINMLEEFITKIKTPLQ